MSRFKNINLDWPVFLLWCNGCNKKHYMQNQPCASCQGSYYTIQPVAENACRASWIWSMCEGCEAYQERYS